MGGSDRDDGRDDGRIGGVGGSEGRSWSAIGRRRIGGLVMALVGSTVNEQPNEQAGRIGGSVMEIVADNRMNKRGEW